MNIEFLNTDYEKVSYLCNLLTSHATGKAADSGEYEKLRYELLSNTEIASSLPQWIKVHRNLDSFWGFIQPKFGSYAERRSFLAEEFALILNFLEFGETTKQTKVSNFTAAKPVTNSPVQTVQQKKTKVFIVHGRDNETKQEVGRFIESIGLEAIILHEQASSGMTIIEKIEHYSSVANFALVLYTACDQGRGAHEAKVHHRNRARQNVIFEHGYLMAKLGRRNVCALVKGDIETPNDISGVVYVTLDAAGAWKVEVVKELKACGYETQSWF